MIIKNEKPNSYNSTKSYDKPISEEHFYLIERNKGNEVTRRKINPIKSFSIRKLFTIFIVPNLNQMDPNFEVIFLEEAIEFLDSLDEKEREKVIYNIDKSRFVNDPKLLKKLTENIWEFRTRFNKKQFRLFAFWDKREEQQTLVVSTHGFVKKTNKVPKKEFEKAERIMEEYFNEE